MFNENEKVLKKEVDEEAKVEKKNVEVPAGCKFVTPAPGRLVRDPITLEQLPDDGMIKAWIGTEGKYWRRRLKQKDIIIK